MDINIPDGVNLILTYFPLEGFIIAQDLMSVINKAKLNFIHMFIPKKNNTKAPKRVMRFEHPGGEVVIVTQTTVKGTLFPEKLAKANAMLKNAKFMDDK